MAPIVAAFDGFADWAEPTITVVGFVEHPPVAHCKPLRRLKKECLLSYRVLRRDERRWFACFHRTPPH